MIEAFKGKSPAEFRVHAGSKLLPIDRKTGLLAQAGDEGQLYGSVSVADVVEGIKRFTGIELDKSQVEMQESIKAIGLHEIQIKAHADVEFPLTLDIIPA